MFSGHFCGNGTRERLPPCQTFFHRGHITAACTGFESLFCLSKDFHSRCPVIQIHTVSCRCRLVCLPANFSNTKVTRIQIIPRESLSKPMVYQTISATMVPFKLWGYVTHTQCFLSLLLFFLVCQLFWPAPLSLESPNTRKVSHV